MTNLSGRAKEFRDAVEKHFFDENGILICNINRHTLKPFTDEDLADSVVTLKGASKAGRWAYEDTLFCTGMYLRALVEEYEVTRDPEVKAIADRVFDNLQPMVQQAHAIEPGYLGKPWGGEVQKETTIDQTLFFNMGLFLYARITDADRAKRAREIVTANVDWWTGRKYRTFGLPAEAPPAFLNPFQGGAALAQTRLAYLCTRDGKYLEACDWLNREHRTDEFQVRRSPQWHPVDENGIQTRSWAFFHFLLGWSLWLLAENDPERRTWWQERFVDQWHRDIKLGMCDDGLAYLAVRVNLKNESQVPIAPEEADFIRNEGFEELKANNLQHRVWASAAKSSHISTHIACCAVQLAEAVPWMRDGIDDTIRCVLENVTLRKCVWMEDPDGTQWPGDERQYTESRAIRCIAPWLITYWKARKLGMRIT